MHVFSSLFWLASTWSSSLSKGNHFHKRTSNNTNKCVNSYSNIETAARLLSRLDLTQKGMMAWHVFNSSLCFSLTDFYNIHIHGSQETSILSYFHVCMPFSGTDAWTKHILIIYHILSHSLTDLFCVVCCCRVGVCVHITERETVRSVIFLLSLSKFSHVQNI